MRRTGNSGARSTEQRSMSTLGVCSALSAASSCGTSGSWVLWVGGLLGRPTTGYSIYCMLGSSSGASKELADDTAIYGQVCMWSAVCGMLGMKAAASTDQIIQNAHCPSAGRAFSPQRRKTSACLPGGRVRTVSVPPHHLLLIIRLAVGSQLQNRRSRTPAISTPSSTLD